MNAAIQRMLAYVPAGIDQDPHDVPALSLSGTGTVSLSDETMYVTSGSAAAAIDLHAQKVSDLTKYLPSGVTWTVLKDGPAELLLWPTALGTIPSGNLPATLNIATSPLWQILASFSRAVSTHRRNRQSNHQQINVRASVGMWLDWWGASLGTSRLTGEPDVLYAARIVGTTLAPNVNNRAIEVLLSSLGYPSSVTDSAPGQLSASISYPSSPPSGFIYSQNQLASIIGQVKAAGVIAAISFAQALSDSFSFSDTVSATSPGGFAVAGTSQAGMCTCA